MRGVPSVLIFLQALPNALPGTAQWVSPYSVGSVSFTGISSIQVGSNAAQNFTLHIVAPGGTPIAGNKLFTAKALAANTTEHYWYEEGQFTLPAGSSVFAFASAVNAINLAIYGWNYP